MKKPRIYVDSSVIGGCCDDEFREESRALLAMASRGQVHLILSELLVRELEGAPEEVRTVPALIPSDAFESVSLSVEAQELRDRYLEANVVGPAQSNDAYHVALATVAKAEMIVSWNFRHIVHFDKIRGFNAVNLREGYLPIEIHSPKEVV
ncbi:MAG: PIN domain protein [Lentisphaerales bacterium]|jgi:predicted nucleic acid-binding protein|nr:MAG: PIN domain protein [Lentisphaerales bacterium]